MADENTPPGGRAGRPFVPPFRGPAAPAREAAQDGRPTTPERPQHRPFVPPAAARPSAPPSPPRPLSPVDATAILDETPAHGGAPEPAAGEVVGHDGLAVEHAISETLGQGVAPAQDPALELERASEGTMQGLPELPTLPDDDSPSGGPDLPLLMPDGREVEAQAPWMVESEAVAAVEGALAGDGAPGAGAAAGAGGDAGTDVGADAGADAGADDAGAPDTGMEAFVDLRAAVVTPEAPAPATSGKRVEAETPSFARTVDYAGDLESRATPPRAAAWSGAAGEAAIVGTNDVVAAALERVARRIREGTLRVPAVDESAGDAGALAAALAVLLGVRS